MILNVLFVTTAVLGFAVTVVLFSIAYREFEQHKLKKYMTNEKGFSELLNYAFFIDQNKLINKNGSVTVMFELYTVDSKTMTEEEMITRNNFFNDAIMSLGKSWTIHLDIRRQKAANTYPTKSEVFFSEVISTAVDNEQRVKFEANDQLFQNSTILSLTYMPDLLVEQKFADMVFTDNEEGKSSKKTKSNDKTKQILLDMDNKLKEFISQLSGGITGLRQLGVYESEGILYSEILEHLQYCISGTDNPVLFPMDGMSSVDNILSEDYYMGTVPYLGDPETGNYIKLIAIDGFPEFSSPDILSSIALLPKEYRWSTRYISLDRQTALSEIDSSRKRWRQKERGFVAQLLNNTNPSKVNLDAVTMVEDALLATQQVESGQFSYGYYTSNIIVRGRSIAEVEEKSFYIAEQIRLKGFKARIESINTNEAYLGSLPSHFIENVRRPLICSINLCDFLPISQIYEGERFSPCDLYPVNAPSLITTVTNGRTPFHFNLHVGDLGHTFIAGMSGGGKSYLLGVLALFLNKYKNMQINVFDVGYSMMPLCHAMNGSHQPLSLENSADKSVYMKENVCFNPVGSLINSAEGRVWLLDEFFSAIYELNNIKYTAALRTKLKEAIDGIVENMELDGSADLSEILFTAQLSEEEKAILSMYSASEPVGKFFDSKEDSFKDSNFRVWDMERLMTMNSRYTIPLLMYLFFRIEMSVKRKAVVEEDQNGEKVVVSSDPSVIIIDEAWVMLKDPLFRSKIEEWLRTLRKYNCAIIMATQNIKELDDSGILPLVIDNCPTKIFLPNSNASNPKVKKIYEDAMGLSEKDVYIITNARSKREYYAISPNGKGIFQLDLSLIGNAISSSDKIKNQLLTKLLNDQKPDWLYHFLYECIVDRERASGNYDVAWVEEYLNKFGIFKETEDVK